ncbi:MAG: hypothetical protein R2991_16555 [Thermoanaerobaculia bacterium]
MRRNRQSELVDGTDRVFQPTSTPVRLSFLDLMNGVGGGEHEPAYLDGATVVAVWPSYGDLARVTVEMWAPDRDTLRQLHELQVDWPPASCDVRVRLLASGRVEVLPCRRSFAREAKRSRTELGRTVWFSLERGGRLLGRPVALAA